MSATVTSLDGLRSLVDGGGFHHATVRTVGRSRIWIYRRDAAGFRGYTLAGAIDDTDENHAYLISIGHGVSVGAFGGG